MKMAATDTFHNVLSEVQKSTLNYRIELSPFSATIYLKNSFVTDKNGNPLFSPSIGHIKPEPEVNRIQNLEKTINSLHEKYENAVHDSENVYQTNCHLENKIQLLHSKLSEAEQGNLKLSQKLASRVDKICATTAKQEADLQNAKQEASDLVRSNDTLNKVVNTFRRELDESKAKSQRELIRVKKECKAEVKSWRKDLGDERKYGIKLEKKLQEELTNITKKDTAETVPSSTVCSSSSSSNSILDPSEAEKVCTLCAEPIPDYTPKYFMGTEIHPACISCQDSSSESDQNHESEEPLTSGKVGANDLGINSVDDHENNSVDDLPAPKDSIIVETKSCEMKDLVTEAKGNVLIKDYLAECLERFKARIGT